MTIQEMAIRMFPMWIMGIIMLITTYRSKNRDLLRIDKEALRDWFRFLSMITVYRIIIFYFFKDLDMLQNAAKAAMTIPWQATFTVFWEDACHGLPLVLLANYLQGKKHEKWINRIVLTIVMISFGSGHLYQGWLAAIGLSFYIPFSMYAGRKYGFGTVMLGHMMYDFITIITLKAALG